MLKLPDFASINLLLIWLSASSTCLFIVIFALYVKDKFRNKKNGSTNDPDAKNNSDLKNVFNIANKKAEEIILQAFEIKKETNNNFEKSIQTLLDEQEKVLRETSEALIIKFQNQTEQINIKNIELLSNIYKDIENDAKSNYEKYKQIIDKQTFEAEKLAQETMRAEYLKLEQEIKKEKEEMLEKINQDIFKIIQNVSKEVIGKSLSLEDRDELIIEALNEARKQKLI